MALRSVTFKLDDAPKWASHFEITHEGGVVLIQLVKRSGEAGYEATIDATEFFSTLDLMKGSNHVKR